MARSRPQSVQRYPLTRILGTEANVRILRELSRHGGQLSASSLVDRTALARTSVWAALAVLVETGIVTAAGTGRTRLYSLASHRRLRAPIDALFRAEERRFEEILDAIRKAATACGQQPVAVWLHGSVARGEDRTDSDLDVVVVGQPDVSVVALDSMRDTLHAAGERLGFAACVVALGPADIMRLARQNDPWWVELARDALALAGPRPDELLGSLRRGTAKRAAA